MNMKSQAINTIKHPSLWEICHKTLRPKGRKGLVRLRPRTGCEGAIQEG